jgi:hypothetical protein
LDAMTPWLLLIIAALIVVSVSLYSHARQVESHTLGRQLLVADELREAEAALHAALEKLRQMDTMLAVRERTLASDGWRPIADGQCAPSPPTALAMDRDDGGRLPGAGALDPSGAAAGGQARDGGATIRLRAEGEEGSQAGEKRVGRTARPPRVNTGEGTGRVWQARVVELARTGMVASQIARELELPVGEVELVLALGPRPSQPL